MGSWSAENATKAYLRAVKMRTAGKEPDVAEFISALAAGNNAQLMVIACASPADSINIILALDAAAQQTGGTVICILPRNIQDYELGRLSETAALAYDAINVKFIMGNSETLVIMKEYYKEADCILVDCKLENCQAIIEGVLKVRRSSNIAATVMAYNARRMGSWRDQVGLIKNDHFLPIGEGLLVINKIAANVKNSDNFAVYGKKNKWVTKIDKYTGEEHVFRI